MRYDRGAGLLLELQLSVFEVIALVFGFVGLLAVHNAVVIDADVVIVVVLVFAIVELDIVVLLLFVVVVAVDVGVVLVVAVVPEVVAEITDRILWLKAFKTLKRIESHLSKREYKLQTFAEFLRVPDNGSLDIESLDSSLIERALNPEVVSDRALDIIMRTRLSSRTLYCGARILGDTPVWPVSLLFAHALQSRAIYNINHRKAVIKR